MLDLRHVALASLLLAGCADAGDEDLSAQASAVTTCATPRLGTGSMCDLGGGQLEFRVTLPSGQRYVEVFARQNGIQNVAVPIVGSGVDHRDGTTTYAFARSGYAASDAVEYRFYSYLPDSPGVFTPGPIEWKWFVRSLQRAASLPVSKDAAVIYASLGVGVAPDRNFGSDADVTIGEYQITSQGLFGYALTGVPAGATVTHAELVLPDGVYSPSGPTVAMTLGQVTAPWSESTVTWNTRPASTPLGEVVVKSSSENRLDVTAAVAAAVAGGAGEVSFVLAPQSQNSSIDNIFVPAKESGHPATSLYVEWH